MPCPLDLDPNDFPDYVKKILKEISLDQTEDGAQLQGCACDLISPTEPSPDFCVIQDEDKKIGLFPFCFEHTEDDPKDFASTYEGSGVYYFFPIKLTLRQMMKLYWNTKKVMGLGFTSSTGCNTSPIVSCNSDPYTNIIKYTPPKYRACYTSLSFDIDRACFDKEAQYGCNICQTGSAGGNLSIFLGAVLVDGFMNQDGSPKYISCFIRKIGNKYYFYPTAVAVFGVSASSAQRYYPDRKSNGKLTIKMEDEPDTTIKLYQPLEDDCCAEGDPNCDHSPRTQASVGPSPIIATIEEFPDVV